MKSWRVLVAAILFLLLVSGGPRAARAEGLQLSENDNNSKVVVDLGKTLELSLPSNPTTGYSWNFANDLDQSVLAETSHSFIPKSQALGAGGTEHWVFQTVKTGAAKLTLWYARPWESVQPVKIYTLEVGVVSSSAPGASNHIRFVVGKTTYHVNGQVFTMDAFPFLSGGRVYMPVRYLPQAFGLPTGSLNWDASAWSVTLPPNRDGVVFMLKIGDKNVYQLTPQGTKAVRVMDVAPVIRDGRTYLPARYIAELYGYQVGWDAGIQTVSIEPGQK